jgi:MFS family permease
MGALTANVARARLGTERTLRVSMFLASGAMAIVALSRWLPLTAAAEVVTGLSSTLVFTSFNVLVQLRAPDRMLGRILSIYQMGAFGGLAIGSWLWGAVAHVTSVTTALLAAAMAMAALIGTALWMPIEDVSSEAPDGLPHCDVGGPPNT